MTTEQTIRRRRGRAIRKARRVRSDTPQELRPALDWVRRIWDRICEAVKAAVHFVQVFAARITPDLLTPHGGGTRRQLLEHGRAPRRGRG